jgi:hypothetical protein
MCTRVCLAVLIVRHLDMSDANDRLYLVDSGKAELRANVQKYFPLEDGRGGMRLGKGNGILQVTDASLPPSLPGP